MRLLSRMCWPCMWVGSALFLLSVEALAADSVQPGALTWRDLALAAVGLVAALAGAYAKGQESRIGKIEDSLAKVEAAAGDLREKVRAEHPDRNGMREAINESLKLVEHRLSGVEASVGAVHRRLDFMRVPSAPPHMRPDDGN